MSSIEDNWNMVGVHHRVDCIRQCLIISFFKLVSTLYELIIHSAGLVLSEASVNCHISLCIVLEVLVVLKDRENKTAVREYVSKVLDSLLFNLVVYVDVLHIYDVRILHAYNESQVHCSLSKFGLPLKMS